MAKKTYIIILPPKGKRRHVTRQWPLEPSEDGGPIRSLCGKSCAGWRLEGVQEMFNLDCVRCMKGRAEQE